MLNKKNIALLAQILTIIFMVFAIKVTFEIFTDSSQKLSKAASQKLSIKTAYTTSNVIDSALSEKNVPEPFVFKKDITSPFSQLDSKPVKIRNTTKVKNVVLRKKVFLKGILDKKNALALLEDEAGKTFICKIGDQVYNWTIAEIRDQHVVIRDGSYEEILKVKGQ